MLAGGIGLVTAGVPPLLLPRHHPPAAVSSPAASSLPPGSAAGTAGSASPAGRAAAAGSAAAAGGACGTGGSTRPACTVYGAAVGTGWTVQSAGVKVVPAGVVPGTDQVALRVEPKDKAASVALVAAVPVTARHLKFRVYGGRIHGTVLRVSASSGAGAAGAGRAPVVLTAPVDGWTSFEVELAEFIPDGTLRRIDFVIATDMVPNAYRFFLDDIQLD